MNWFFGDALVDQLEMMLRVIFGSVIIDDSRLSASIESYSEGAYEVVAGIHSTVVMPVAAVIISMMAVLELARQATHIEADRDLGVKIIAATMFKLVLLVVIAQNSDLVLGAINGAVDTLTQGAADYSNPGEAVDSNGLPEGVHEALLEANFFDRMGVMFILFVPWLLMQMVSMLVAVIVWLRFMELYLLTAFATLPIAFFANPDTKPIAIGYLRRYASVGLQATVLMVIFILWNRIGPALLGGESFVSITDAGSLSSWAVQNFAYFTIGSIALGFLVLSSSRIAKALVGEG